MSWTLSRGWYLDPGSRETTLSGLRRRLGNTMNVEDDFPLAARRAALCHRLRVQAGRVPDTKSRNDLRLRIKSDEGPAPLKCAEREAFLPLSGSQRHLLL